MPLDQSRNGFCSRYFLVKKKGGVGGDETNIGSTQPQISEEILFQDVDESALLHMMRRGDWYATIVLKDAYFHIPIYPPHRAPPSPLLPPEE